MFSVAISDQQRKDAYEMVRKYNFGRRGRFDGDTEKQYTGILGQIVMADALDLPRPDGKEGFDDGVDFEIFSRKIDLKTMGRTTDVRHFYVNNLVASQVDYSTDVYVFASIHKVKREMTIVGILEKYNLDRFYFPAGSERRRSDGTTFFVKEDMFEIPNKALVQVDSWLSLTWAIDQCR